MNIAKFIEDVIESLGLDDIEKPSEKRSMRKLLKKLNAKKEKIVKALEKKPVKKVKRELQEEFDIVALQIKKAQKILDKLSS